MQRCAEAARSLVRLGDSTGAEFGCGNLDSLTFAVTIYSCGVGSVWCWFIFMSGPILVLSWTTARKIARFISYFCRLQDPRNNINNGKQSEPQNMGPKSQNPIEHGTSPEETKIRRGALPKKTMRQSMISMMMSLWS